MMTPKEERAWRPSTANLVPSVDIHAPEMALPSDDSADRQRLHSLPCLQLPHLQRRHVADMERFVVGCVTVLGVCDLAVLAVLFKMETGPDWPAQGRLLGCANAGTGEKPSVGRHRDTFFLSLFQAVPTFHSCNTRSQRQSESLPLSRLSSLAPQSSTSPKSRPFFLPSISTATRYSTLSTPSTHHNHLHASITAHSAHSTHQQRHPPAARRRSHQHCHSTSSRRLHHQHPNATLAASSLFMTFSRLAITKTKSRNRVDDCHGRSMHCVSREPRRRVLGRCGGGSSSRSRRPT